MNEEKKNELKKIQALDYYHCLHSGEKRDFWYRRLDFYFNKAQKKIDSLLEEQESEYFKNIRSQKRDSTKAIQYVNLMKKHTELQKDMSLFDEEVATSHRLASDYKNEFLKYENLFNILKLKEYLKFKYFIIGNPNYLNH